MGRSITDQLAEAQPRWSTDRKHSPNIPVYVPPEMFRVGKGQGMEIFMLRAQFADMQRISDNKKEDEWYARKRRREDAPVYNAKGERVNTPQNVFKKKRTQVLDELLKWSNRVNDMDAAKTETGPTKKIYFTKEQMQAKTFAAILGARGKTHQELQQSTGCRITLMGRGISDQLKIKGPTEHRAGDDDAPHCHITAPDEESLARCVERVEFIMSDKREAVEFRNEKRKELAILNGTYREETWNKNNPVPGQVCTGGLCFALRTIPVGPGHTHTHTAGLYPDGHGTPAQRFQRRLGVRSVCQRA